MPERPRPDIDHTREALRQHDERLAEDEEEEEREAEESKGSGSGSGSDEDEGS